MYINKSNKRIYDNYNNIFLILFNTKSIKSYQKNIDNNYNYRENKINTIIIIR